MPIEIKKNVTKFHKTEKGILCSRQKIDNLTTPTCHGLLSEILS